MNFALHTSIVLRRNISTSATEKLVSAKENLLDKFDFARTSTKDIKKAINFGVKFMSQYRFTNRDLECYCLQINYLSLSHESARIL